MSIRITDDPEKDFDDWDYEQNELLKKLPKCDECDEYIQDDYFFEIGDMIICSDCMNTCFKKYTDDYILS